MSPRRKFAPLRELAETYNAVTDFMPRFSRADAELLSQLLSEYDELRRQNATAERRRKLNRGRRCRNCGNLAGQVIHDLSWSGGHPFVPTTGVPDDFEDVTADTIAMMRNVVSR